MVSTRGIGVLAGSFAVGAIMFLAPCRAQSEQLKHTCVPVGMKGGKANWALFNSPICTHRGVVFIAFVGPNPRDGTGYQTVVGKLADGKWQFSVVEPNNLNDPWHAQPSLVVDAAGHVHVTYNMHSSPWQYCVSLRPADIRRWVFRGQKLRGPHDRLESGVVYGEGRAAIPGNRITYQFMTTDRNGVPYVIFREALKNLPGTDYFKMQWSLGIARYDARQRKWLRVGPGRGVRVFATEPGRRVQGGRVYFDPNNRMHVSWIWYAEYEKDGSGHLKPNWPGYAYSDDCGTTFHRADGKPLKLPVRLADVPKVISPDWLEPTEKGYFAAYTELCASPHGVPYLWVEPKAPRKGRHRAIIQYLKDKGWNEPMLTPYAASRFTVDSKGRLTAISSGICVHRSHDSGRTWQHHTVPGSRSSMIWLDYAYSLHSDGVRFLAMENETGELKVYTVEISAE